MLRIVFASVVIGWVVAHRVQDLNDEIVVKNGDDFKSQNQFGASCEDLQTMFHDRVVAFQVVLDANPDLSATGHTTRARLIMRAYGIIRTLRRANTCSWVTEGNSEDMEQMRHIVQTLIAGNPCAEAARAELQKGASSEIAEIKTESLQRSMSILVSENCEVIEVPQDQVDSTTLDAAVSEAEAEAEAVLQDQIDELMDGSEGSEGAFIQSDARAIRGFMRGLGLAFLIIFLALACGAAGYVIGAVIPQAIFALAAHTTPILRWIDGSTTVAYFLVGSIYAGAFLGGGFGFITCGYGLYNEMLN